MTPQSLRCPTARRSEQGFVIVAVLWILILLSSLVMIFSSYLSNSAQALAVSDTGVQAEALVSAGVELTAYQLQLAGDDARPAQGSFHVRLGGADLSIAFVSEAARIDLNFASKDILTNLFAGLGAGEEQSTQYAERIVAWRTRPPPGTADNEESLYRAAGLSYSPRQAPFEHVRELGLVVGLPPALVDRVLPFVTVFSRVPQVDGLVAPPEVIAALPGMTPSALHSFLQERPALPRQTAAVAAALGPAQASATVQKSDAYRVLTTVKFSNGRQTSSEVVITLSKNATKDETGREVAPYRVLSWQDDVEAVRRPQKTVQF
jgi:general secretion pathway protein K